MEMICETLQTKVEIQNKPSQSVYIKMGSASPLNIILIFFNLYYLNILNIKDKYTHTHLYNNV